MASEFSNFIIEHNIVEKVVEVCVVLSATDSEETIRIFALRDAVNGGYHTRAERLETFLVRPTYPIQGNQENEPQEEDLWIRHDIASTHATNADDAIQQALAWLAAECKELKAK